MNALSRCALLLLVTLTACDEMRPRPTWDSGVSVTDAATGDIGTRSDSGVTADTFARADALVGDSGPICLTSSSTSWTNQAITAQSGTFRLELEATPSHKPMDAVTGLSLGPAGAYADLAANVRFGGDKGTIDARDGAAYNDPSPAISFSAGTTYSFRLELDVAHGLYSAYVTPAGGKEQTIGEQLSFRDTQQGVTQLDNLGLFGSSNYPAASHEVCGVRVTPTQGYCGNKIQEPGEGCDDTLPCCDSTTCAVRSSGATCRPKAGECDLAETCDGASTSCPADKHVADGTPCSGGGTCQQGSCVNNEILRVDFDSQPLDGYTQADFDLDFNLTGVTKRHWTSNHDRTDIVGAPQAYSGRSLRGKFLMGIVGQAGAPLQAGLDLLQPYEELYVSCRVKFHSGFDFVKGGKLPGVGGGAHNTGGNPPDPVDPEGFSVRMMWRTGGKVVFYVYHADQGGQYGDDFVWTCGAQDCTFTPGTWHTIEQRIKMNTPGQKDGVIQGWLDGKLALTVSNLRFRDTKTSFSIDMVLWSNFFGGDTSDWAPTKDEKIYFDDFVLSQQPITH